ncbi:hypothetical protein E4U54_003013, partial [Claviceps lovelessii]
MARTKRAPVQRESSSEFFDKKTARWQDGGAGESNGLVKSAANGAVGGGGGGNVDEDSRPEAGVVQLVISVA